MGSVPWHGVLWEMMSQTSAHWLAGASSESYAFQLLLLMSVTIYIHIYIVSTVQSINSLKNITDSLVSFLFFFLPELQPDRLCQNPFFILQVQKDNIHSYVAEAAPLCIAFLGWVISSGLFYEIGIKELTAKVMSLKPVWMSVIWNAFSKWQIWWNSMTSCSQCL